MTLDLSVNGTVIAFLYPEYYFGSNCKHSKFFPTVVHAQKYTLEIFSILSG